jgi:hypothetical protein
MDDPAEVKSQLMEIHRQWLVANVLLADEMLHDVDFDVMKDVVHLQLVAQMGKKIASNKITSQVVRRERVPAAGLDWLKTLLPAFLRRRFPPKMREIETLIEFHHMCPHIDVRSNRAHYEFLMQPGVTYRFGKRGWGDEQASSSTDS